MLSRFGYKIYNDNYGTAARRYRMMFSDRKRKELEESVKQGRGAETTKNLKGP